MPRLTENLPLLSASGERLSTLLDINALAVSDKERIYAGLIPPRIFELLHISPHSFTDRSGSRLVKIIAPEGMNLARLEVRQQPADQRTVFFLDIAGTHYNQMELSFCIINDPSAPRFNVDVDEHGNDNCFSTLGRNIPEEIRAMQSGLFPNQTCRGLRMFAEFFTNFERFVDALGMEMIVAEPLTYDNAVRYEKYGFDYLSGRRLMLEIDREFRPGGVLQRRLDGSTPFRRPGMELTVHGRSWAIHDGILDEAWEDVRIYKTIGKHAGINTFTGRG
jgi:hypothetical protein